MKRFLFPAFLLAVFFLAGRFWSELSVTASGQGTGAAFGGNGDVNGDGERDMSDAIYLLSWLFLGTSDPVACADGGSGLTPEQAEILSHMSIVAPPEMGGKKTLRISGINVQIVNGLGTTATKNGTGNLIVGYNELRNDPASPDVRTGSHNVVGGIGSNHSSYGGLVVGYRNSISSIYCSVSGGSCNAAEGSYSSVSGGGSSIPEWGNKALGDYSSIGGGANNRAYGEWSTVVGGRDNNAGKVDGSTGLYSTISGGRGNRTNGVDSSVSGGNGSTTDKDGEVLGDSFSKPRFVDNGDGTVTDKRTGLMWQKIADPTETTWGGADWFSRILELAGHTDWRLPSLGELMSIVDETRSSPAIDPVFDGEFSSSYWTCSNYAYNTDFVCCVSFAPVGFEYIGYDEVLTTRYKYWRAVRNGR